MNHLHYALPSAIFFALLAWVLVTFGGNHFVTSLVVFALLAGAVGQFLSQSSNVKLLTAAEVLTASAIVFATIATFVFVLA